MAQTIKLKRSATAGAEPTKEQLELGEVAINTYDGKMYIKKSVAGTESIVEISGAGGAEAIFVEYLYTATASQTAFSGNDDNSDFLSYEVGAIQVFLNGILLDPETDYTATNGALITLASAAAVDDYLQIFAFKKKISDGNVTVDAFSGNNSTTAFTLTLDPGDENNTRVFIDGVYQSKSNYTVSGTTLTFSTAPPSGTAIEVEIGNRVVTLDTLSDLDLPDNVKLRLGTSQDLEIYHNATDSVINQTGTGDLLIQKDETTVAEFNVEGLTVTGSVEADEFIGDVRGAVLFKAQAGESLAKGEVVYISGISGNTTIVSKADADDASKMPAFGLVAAAASSGNPVDIYTNGILSGIDTSSYSEGDELFVSTTAGALTATPPTGESSALQKIGKVTRSASNGSIFIVGAGRSNAVSNLDDGDIFIGNSSNQAVSASLNTKIESYLDGGTSTPTFSTINSGNITTTGELRGPASFTIDPAAVGDNTGTVIIKGNLQVDGATTTINSTTLTVDDLNLTLASGAANGTAANGAGITIDGASATLTYASAGDNWAFNKNVGVTGTITTNSGGGSAILGSHLDLGDNQKARFGAGDDLQIYHDGSHSYVSDQGTGDLRILAADFRVRNAANDETMIQANADADVSLWYNNSKKLATTNTGIDVTGTVTADGLTVSNAGSNSFIKAQETTGAARLQLTNSGANILLGSDNSSGGLTGVANQAYMYSANPLKIGVNTFSAQQLTINSSGIDVTGNIVVSGTVDGVDIAARDAVLTSTTTTAGAALPKAGGTLTGNLSIGGATPQGNLTIKGAASDDIDLLTFSEDGTNQSFSFNGNFAGTGSAGNALTLDSYWTNDIMSWTGDGKVGIGTATPNTTLTLSDGTDEFDFGVTANLLMIKSVTTDGSDDQRIIIDAGNGGTTSTRGAYLALSGNEAASEPGKAVYQMGNVTGSAHLFRKAGGVDAVTIDSSGKVLIGDTASHTTDLLQIETPASGGGHGIQIRRNDANNDQGIGHILFGNNTATDLVKISAKTDGDSNAGDSGALMFSTQVTGGNLTERLRIDSSGNVGIGTIDPQTSLHLSKATTGPIIRLQNSTNGIGENILLGGIEWFNTDSSGEGPNVVSAIESYSGGSSGNDGYLTFSTYNSSESDSEGQRASEKMRLTTEGNVGIGTTSPTEKLEVAGTALVENAKLKAIAASNSDTARDVFVYDTRKDSDGGAWRKRTQHTSWYNETLNTSTRGARKEFPSVAVIVAETTQLTIYDGDDPDLPMWMVFNSSGVNGAAMLGRSTETTTSIAMLNGILSVGRSSFGLHIVHFISDFAEFKEAGYDTPYALPIGTNRNSGNSWVTVNRGNDLVNDTINDVAMTVLPNAPIDADTGLPVPTIAVATAGGTSVIKDDGTIGTLTGFSPVTGVTINSTTLSLYSNSGGNGYLAVGSSSVASGSAAYDASGGWLTNKSFQLNSSTNTALLGETATFGAQGSSNEIHAAGSEGYNIFLPSTGGTQDAIAYIASDYNTGWMNGDIKLATLSDTDTTNAVSANMAGNGNFADTSVWGPANGATLSVSGNVATITANGSTTQAYIGQTVSGLTVGKQYMITCDAKRGTTSAGAAITVNGILSAQTTSTSFVPLHVTFTATATSQLVLCFLNGTGSQSGTALFQNFTFRLAEADRSVNGAHPQGGNALQVFGTVTKTAVATGAELVGYSGFSTSNYLLQPYNAALNFTNEFSISFWVKNWSAGQDLLHRGPGQTRNSKTSFHMYCDGGYDYRLTLTSNGSSEQNFEIPLSGNLTGWQNVCFTLTPGGAVRGYLNGRLEFTGAFTGTNIFTQATDQNGLYIGDGPVSAAFGGSLALLRLSATAPSAEQIKKIYNDEKHLFATNAKATIAGTSDAVTALAYDDDTELLHVGTSAGRSVFQGLNRVDNTTDAVGAAISASNGFIVED